jgi:pantetheine-phosphate adenylyltransferase
MEQIKLVPRQFPNVEVDYSEELTAVYARRVGATVVVRGLRALSDYERECQIALVNKQIYPELETIFLAASEKYMYLSSSAVKELAAFGADLTDFAPGEIIPEIEAKYKDRRKK